MDGEPPKKQANLSQFFGGRRASKVSNHEQGSTSQATMTKVRRLHRSTAEKWNTFTKGLAKYSSSVLLVLNGKGDFVRGFLVVQCLQALSKSNLWNETLFLELGVFERKHPLAT